MSNQLSTSGKTRPGPFAYLLLALAVALALPLALAPSAAAGPTAAPAADPACRTTWGSQLKQGADYPPDVLPVHPGGVEGVRAGRHACFDRLVIDLGEPGTTWTVQYVDQVRTGGAGDVVPTAGGARLQVSVMANEYIVDLGTGQTRPIYDPTRPSRVFDVTGFNTFRQVTYGGSFEAVHTFGLGVRARLPFQVAHYPGPGDGSRLVIDVAHSWS